MSVFYNFKNNYSMLAGTLLLLGSTALTSCEKTAIQTLQPRKWEVVWTDNFDGPVGASPNAANWTYDVGATGWGNQELQNYTDRPSNVSLDGSGNLVITARRESFGGAAFTSARIKTQGKFQQAFGRFEARLKAPSGPGIWPAFWLLGGNINTVSWPQCGEIDIMEQRGQEPNVNHGSMHGPGYSGGNAITKSFTLSTGRFDTDFHVYAVEWGKDYVDYYVNDFLYQRITPKDASGEWVFNAPFFMILNIAVGGNYVGFPTTGTPFPQQMVVDYIKVFKEVN